MGVTNTSYVTSSYVVVTSSFGSVLSAMIYVSGSIGLVTGSKLAAQFVQSTAYVSYVQSGSTGTGTGTGTSCGPTLYVITGYYPATNSRETWSGNSVNTPPPSGHTLVDVTVVGMYPPKVPW